MIHKEMAIVVALRETERNSRRGLRYAKVKLPKSWQKERCNEKKINL